MFIMIMVFDNRLAPSTRYKRGCSNELVLLNMDCGFFYFDELVTYYAVSCSARPGGLAIARLQVCFY